MADKAKDEMVEVARTRIPTPTEVAVASFHQGAHPQRPLPPDMTEAERVALDRERSNIHAGNRVPMEEPGTLPGEGSGVMIPGFRPSAGRLFTGATAREEALLSGIDPKTLDLIEKEQAERAEGWKDKDAEEQAAAARNERRSAPERGPEPDAPHHTEATMRAADDLDAPKRKG